jgi:hypothetical protein
MKNSASWFNNSTQDGEAMEEYARLLKSVLKSIRGTVEQKSGAVLKGRGGKFIPDTVKAAGEGGFELVTWLVVG